MNARYSKLPALFLALIATICPPNLSGQGIELPRIGDSTEGFLSTEAEQYYGEAFMRSIRHSLELVSDPEVQSYIESLGNRLAASSGARGRSFNFFVIRDPMINAFAGPGGYIGINSGLIITTHSEAELSSVMAHEIAHVTQRHLARSYEAASRMSIPVTAAILAAIILGANSSSDVGEAAIAAATAGSVQQQINFTRANEMEADRIGLQILAESGYEPRAMPRFFERLQQASQFYDNLQLEFLRTHPVTLSRISDTGNRAAQYPEMNETINHSYYLVREKIRILQQDDPQRSIHYYQAALEEIPEDKQEAARYGYALALLANAQPEAARAELEPLIENKPEYIPFQIALADIELGAGNTDKALEIYRHNLKLYPFHLPLTILYANALVQDSQAAAAIQVINEYNRERSPRPELYRLLAQARNINGERSEAHQAQSEYYYLLGETRAAIEQLQLALDTMNKDDEHRRVRLEARVKLLENEWKTRMKIVGEAAQ